MKRTLIVIGLILGFVFIIQVVSAQPPPPPPQDIPIDGGLLALLTAGLIYGAKEIYKYEKKNKKK